MGDICFELRLFFRLVSSNLYSCIIRAVMAASTRRAGCQSFCELWLCYSERLYDNFNWNLQKTYFFFQWRLVAFSCVVQTNHSAPWYGHYCSTTNWCFNSSFAILFIFSVPTWKNLTEHRRFHSMMFPSCDRLNVPQHVVHSSRGLSASLLQSTFVSIFQKSILLQETGWIGICLLS